MEKTYIKPNAEILNLGLKEDITEGMGTMTQGAEFADGKGSNDEVIDDENDSGEPQQNGWEFD